MAHLLAGWPAGASCALRPPARPAGNLGRATVWRLALEAQRAHLGRRCGPPGLCKPSRRRRRLSQSGSLWAEERRGDACAWRAHDAFNYGPIVFPCRRSRGSNQDQVSRAASCSPAHLSAGGRVGCDRSQWPPQLAQSASVRSGGRRGASWTGASNSGAAAEGESKLELPPLLGKFKSRETRLSLSLTPCLQLAPGQQRAVEALNRAQRDRRCPQLSPPLALMFARKSLHSEQKPTPPVPGF